MYVDDYKHHFVRGFKMAEFPPIFWWTSTHSDRIPCSKILFKGVGNEGILAIANVHTACTINNIVLVLKATQN